MRTDVPHLLKALSDRMAVVSGMLFGVAVLRDFGVDITLWHALFAVVASWALAGAAAWSRRRLRRSFGR